MYALRDSLGNFARVSKPEATVVAAEATPESPATRVCVSLDEVHVNTLSERTRHFNLGPTAVFKLLLEVDARDGTVAREVALRLNPKKRRRSRKPQPPAV